MEGKYTTGQFAKKANVSKRTIRYYETKGLIKPRRISEAGYRFYNDEDFARLQRILTLKYLGFSLEEIEEISIHEENSDFLQHSFELQLRLVRKKKEQLAFMEDSLKKVSDIFSKTNEVDWTEVIRLIQLMNMEKDLGEQYKNAQNIDARIKLHQTYSSQKQDWFQWLFEKIDWTRKERILELGCGNGEFWKKNDLSVLKQADMILSDISAGVLADAKRNLGAKAEDFSFRAFDCHEIPYADSTYDIVIANHVMFYLKDLNRALSEICRILKPGGKFYCATYGEKHMSEIESMVKEFDPRISLSQVKLYEIFGLENGGERLELYFDSVLRMDYDDMLRVTDVSPLLDYIMSCHGNQREYLLPRYEEFRRFLQKKCGKEGKIGITKQAGIFCCSLPK